MLTEGKTKRNEERKIERVNRKSQQKDDPKENGYHYVIELEATTISTPGHNDELKTTETTTSDPGHNDEPEATTTSHTFTTSYTEEDANNTDKEKKEKRGKKKNKVEKDLLLESKKDKKDTDMEKEYSIIEKIQLTFRKLLLAVFEHLLVF